MQGESDAIDGADASAAEPTDPRPELEVEVDERIEAALYTDAERQGVSPTDLAGHAVLVYLAELDLVGDPEPVDGPATAAFAGHPPDGSRTPH